MTRDNLPRPNCDSDGKADNKRQAFIHTDTRRFKIQMGYMGPPPPGRASVIIKVVVVAVVLVTSIKENELKLNKTWPKDLRGKQRGGEDKEDYPFFTLSHPLFICYWTMYFLTSPPRKPHWLNRTAIVFVSSVYVAVTFLRALAYFQKHNLRTRDVQNFAAARNSLAKLNDIISSVKVFFMVR